MSRLGVKTVLALIILLFLTGCHEKDKGSNVSPVNSLGAPVISNIQPLVSTDQIAIEWNTDKPATSQVVLGSNSEAYTYGTLEDYTLVTEHHINLVYLAANTTYYFKVISVDADHNASLSDEKTFYTLD